MSTLTFHFKQGDEPSPDELLHQQAIRAMLASCLEVPEEQLRSAWTIISNREFRCSVHAALIPRKWLDVAESLTRLGLINGGYEWHGEIEEAKHDGTLDKDGKVRVCLDTDIPFEDRCVHITYAMPKEEWYESVSLEASEALELLAWLTEKREQLERLAKEHI